jgi:alpha-beta hydrolase superfamily lysophospholipase
MLGIDRPGHGYSEGPRGDCTIEEALEVTRVVLALARARFGLPVVLMGSSLGGLITGFAVMAGLQPELAIAHNFLIPGRPSERRTSG